MSRPTMRPADGGETPAADAKSWAATPGKERKSRWRHTTKVNTIGWDTPDVVGIVAPPVLSGRARMVNGCWKTGSVERTYASTRGSAAQPPLKLGALFQK